MVKVPICHPGRTTKGYGLCGPCYDRGVDAVGRPRATCHPDRPSKIKGKCNECYHKDRWAEGLTSKPTPEQRKKSWLVKRYNISWVEYHTALSEQIGSCAICGGVNKDGRDLSVDHNHVTGKVRGLLCHNCNVGIGFLQDSTEVLERALRYLRQHEGEQNECSDNSRGSSEDGLPHA